MKFAKSILTGTGAVVLAGLILTLLAPKAVHAVVATAVSVVNTSATPVPVSSINEPGRIPYQAHATNAACLGMIACTYTFAIVPNNHRLVIQQVSGYLSFQGTGFAGGTVYVGSSFSPFANFPVVGPTFAGPLQGYVNSGDFPTVQETFYGGNTSNGFGHIDLTGYLLDCLVANCAAIVAQ